MRTSQCLFVIVQVSVVLVLISSTQPDVQVEAGRLGQYAYNVKDYLVNMVKDKVINKSKVMVEFQDTMAKIKARFLEEKTDSMSADESDALYYRIVVDETRKLRERVEGENKLEKVSEHDAAELVSNFEANKNRIGTDPRELIDGDDDVAEEEELLMQLDETAANEAEMGFSMSPESREALKKRTKALMGELMQNEIRQLALAMLQAYMSGSGLAPLVYTLAASIRFKLVEFLVNAVLDLLATIMGRPIQVDQASNAIAPRDTLVPT